MKKATVLIVDGAACIRESSCAERVCTTRYEFVGIGALIGIFFLFLVVRLFTRSMVRPLQAMQNTACAIARQIITLHEAQVLITSETEVGTRVELVFRTIPL